MVGQNVSAANGEDEHLDRAGNNGQDQYEDGVLGQAGGRQLKPGSYHDERQTERSDLGSGRDAELLVNIVESRVANDQTGDQHAEHRRQL